MDDIRMIHNNDKVKRKRNYKFLKYLYRNRVKVLILFGVIFLLCYPSISGEFIGTWYKEFVGSILENSKF